MLWQPEERWVLKSKEDPSKREDDFYPAIPTVDYFDGLDWLNPQNDGRGPASHFCRIDSPNADSAFVPKISKGKK